MSHRAKLTIPGTPRRRIEGDGDIGVIAVGSLSKSEDIRSLPALEALSDFSTKRFTGQAARQGLHVTINLPGEVLLVPKTRLCVANPGCVMGNIPCFIPMWGGALAAEQHKSKAKTKMLNKELHECRRHEKCDSGVRMAS
jgi:hypothetical protein